FARGMEKQKHAPKPELQHHAPSVTVFAGGKRTVGRDGQQVEPWHLYRSNNFLLSVMGIFRFTVPSL
ncbi:hypothetical protein, partial [Chlorobium phaeovibrioides]|uniref:hypothetical protein n=1 Tax=Chlorobium phaeovibrioides TaxID=1094 RepID=UPI001F15FBA4